MELCMQNLQELLAEAATKIKASSDLKTLELCRIHYLGKKGALTGKLKTLGNLEPAERPAAGQAINAAKTTILSLLDQREDELQRLALEKKLEAEALDITLPGRISGMGSIHPINQTFSDLRQIFLRLGFVFMSGPEIEEDYYNFTALNIPPLHPARAMQDTLYFADGLLLRSHVSPVQIHAMKKMQPPLRMVAMGRVYRHDFDVTHTPMFHQLECLVIDQNVSLGDLKGFLTYFLQAYFQTDAPIRFRPSYFPFTEPSAEVDIGCFKCQGEGCRICKNTGWLEVLGAGLVHPNVLQEVGIDSEKYNGFAFGVGVDRLTLLKYGMDDLRALFENDLRLLKQIRLSSLT